MKVKIGDVEIAVDSSVDIGDTLLSLTILVITDFEDNDTAIAQMLGNTVVGVPTSKLVGELNRDAKPA